MGMVYFWKSFLHNNNEQNNYDLFLFVFHQSISLYLLMLNVSTTSQLSSIVYQLHFAHTIVHYK